MRRPPNYLTIRHAPKGQPYHVANSIRGLHETARLGFNAQDIDCLVSKDGIPVATHWKRPLRHGFTWTGKGRPKSGVKVSQLTVRQMRLRMEANPGRYVINSLGFMLQTASELDVTICLELKPDRRWRTPEPYACLIHWAERYDASLIVMSQPRMFGRGVRYLKAAKKAGLPTMLLTRGPVAPWWWKHLTYAKGPRRFAGRRDPQVTWLGPGSPNGGTRIA